MKLLSRQYERHSETDKHQAREHIVSEHAVLLQKQSNEIASERWTEASEHHGDANSHRPARDIEFTEIECDSSASLP